MSTALDVRFHTASYSGPSESPVSATANAESQRRAFESSITSVAIVSMVR